MKKYFILSLFFVATSFVFAQFGGFDIGDAVKGIQGGSKVVKGASGISLKEEMDVGGSLAMEIAARKGGILKQTDATKRVATIGQALALYSTRPEVHYTFAVLNSSEINAISCPGGYVFITKGLLDSCKSDNELAGILAHEIAHITRRHALKLIARNEGFKGMAELGSVFSGGNLSGFDDIIEKTIQTLLEKGFDPETEFDADIHGTRLLYDAGFPPKTLRDYLANLKTENKPFSTHPANEDRVDKLDGELKKLK
jgi:beta-barrel assembly-enhancing protease